MAFSLTAGQMIADVRARANLGGGMRSVILVWLNEAAQEIASGRKQEYMRRTSKFVTVAAKANYSLPDRYDHIKGDPAIFEVVPPTPTAPFTLLEHWTEEQAARQDVYY